jgi:hypothetical protein
MADASEHKRGEQLKCANGEAVNFHALVNLDGTPTDCGDSAGIFARRKLKKCHQPLLFPNGILTCLNLETAVSIDRSG